MKEVKKPDHEKVAALVTSIENKIGGARGDLERARIEADRAGLAMELNVPGAEGTHQKAVKTVETLQRDINRLEGALEHARGQYSDELRAHREAEEARRWKHTEELAAKRLELARELEADAKLIVAKLKKLTALGEETYRAAPPTETAFHGSPLGEIQVIHDFAMMLRKLGWKWVAKEPPCGDYSAPDFVSRVAGGNGWILKKKNNQENIPSAAEILS